MRKFDFLSILIIILVFAIIFALGFTLGINKEKQNEKELISLLPKQEQVSSILVQLPTTYSGKASFYTNEYCKKYNPSCITASGDVFDDSAFTCACSDDFRLGSKLLVTHKDRNVEVICTDRGSFEEKYGRILDLSQAAFQSLAPTSSGVIAVTIKEI